MSRRHIGGVDIKLHTFLTSALDGGEVSFMPQPLYPRGKDSLVQTGQEAGCAPEPVWMQQGAEIMHSSRSVSYILSL